MRAFPLPHIGDVAKGLCLAAVLAQSAPADQGQPVTVAMPEMMMAQLRDIVQTAAAEVLPVNATVTIGSSGMVFPPLTMPNPADPDFVNGLQQSPSWLGGWIDWREDLSGMIDADSLAADLAASSFVDETNAAITQAVYSTGPDFDLLSIFHVPQPNRTPPAADQAKTAPQSSSDAGFFSQ